MKSRLHASHCCIKAVRMNSDGVVFQHTSPCSYYGTEISGGRGTLFRHSLPVLSLTQLSLTRLTCVTLAVTQFGMDVLSYQGLFIFQIKSFSCFQPRTPTGLKYSTYYIWEILGTHGRGSFKALVSSPGALSRTINIDLLKIWATSVYTCLFNEKDTVSLSMSIQGLHQPSLSNWPKLWFEANRLSRCSPLYCIESNTSAGHCPAINHRLRAAWGEWGDVAWCISHMLDSWAHCEYLQNTSETINCYLNPEATKSLKGI